MPGPRRGVVGFVSLKAAEKRAAGLDDHRPYVVIELTCGHHVLRRGSSPSRTVVCGHCGESRRAP